MTGHCPRSALRTGRRPPAETTTTAMPNRHGRLHTLAACAGILAPAAALAAPAPPSSPHPRLYLTADMLTALKADAMKAGTTAAALVKRCDETIASPQDY